MKVDCKIISDQKWKKGDILESNSYKVVYTGKHKKCDDFFEGVVVEKKDGISEVGHYYKAWLKKFFKKVSSLDNEQEIKEFMGQPCDCIYCKQRGSNCH